MASGHQALHDAFIAACWTGELLKAQEAIASMQFTLDELDEGLIHATHEAHSDIVAALFDAGARVSPSTVDALIAPKQNPNVLLQFLQHGLDPNARQSDGEPLLGPLIDPACAHVLLSRGVDPNICGPAGISALSFAVRSSKDSELLLELLDLLLAHGAKLEPDLLFDAVTPRVRHQELMTRFLLAKGLDPTTTINAEWGTPLHLAVYAGKPNLVKLLMDAGADPTIKVSGRRFPGMSPLQMAQDRRDRYPERAEYTQAMLDILQRGL
jgi:ankyrin repeat protein